MLVLSITNPPLTVARSFYILNPAMNQPQPTILYHTKQATKTRRNILDVAMDIASAEGLEGLSIGRLASELEMSKTGIFAHFGSKEALQIATVEAAKEVFLKEVVQPALASPRGVARLNAMMNSWLGYVERIVFRGGCFFAAASAEFDSRPGHVHDQIAALTKSWLRAIEEEIIFAQSAGEILAPVDAIQLAFELHAYVQEANWAFKLFSDTSVFMRARHAIASRLSSASARNRHRHGHNRGRGNQRQTRA
jgi:AcrR family transcriptional regulator